MSLARAALAVILATTAAAGCAKGARAPAAKPSVAAKARSRAPAAPAEWFWEPVEAETHPPARRPVELPIAEGGLAKVDGGDKLWDELGAEARERLRRDGVLVLAEEPSLGGGHQTIGAFYGALREQRLPTVLTVDALFALVQLALERALADVEELDLAPAFTRWLAQLEARLTKDDIGGGTELTEASRVARGVIAVARALAEPRAAVAPLDKELAAAVSEERTNIEAAAGPSTSPLLGTPLDYGRFVVPSASARPGLYRALAWLGAAPFALVGRGEVDGARAFVSRSRVQTRAAMLLARACDRDVDAGLAAAYAHLTRVLSFVWGTPDDLSLVELDELAAGASVDLTKPLSIRNVTSVDKLRTRARAGRGPAIFDGSGSVGRAGLGVRVFGGHASADSLVLESLVGDAVGAVQKGSSPPAWTVRKERRVMPPTLDLIAWLGTPEARTLLRDSHADAFEGYDAALLALQRTRPVARPDTSSPLHAAVYGSLVDAVIAWGSATEAEPPASPPLARRRIESLLVAWTRLRHASQPFARAKPWVPPAETTAKPPIASPPVIVEALPNVVCRLVAAVRQLRRGLERLAPATASAPSAAALGEVEELLKIALRGAERAASDDPPTADETAALATLPARITRLENEATESEIGPIAAIVYSDPASRRVLVSATGRLEPALLVVREPGSARDEPLLAVGAHFAHHELVESLDGSGAASGKRGKATLTDAAWRARVKSASPAGWTAAFRGLK